MKPLFLMGILCLMTRYVLQAQSKLQLVRDSVRVIDAELVVRNSSKAVQGYLYNTGNGVTQFRIPDLGRQIQFKTGQAGYPIAGDTVYTDATLIGRAIVVWRNGLMQYRNVPEGISADSSLGKVIFRPALKSGDRVYIEAFTGVSMVY